VGATKWYNVAHGRGTYRVLARFGPGRFTEDDPAPLLILRVEQLMDGHYIHIRDYPAGVEGAVLEAALTMEP
jgi:hypothetical protein